MGRIKSQVKRGQIKTNDNEIIRWANKRLNKTEPSGSGKSVKLIDSGKIHIFVAVNVAPAKTIVYPNATCLLLSTNKRVMCSQTNT